MIPNWINPDTENQDEYIVSAAIYFNDKKLHNNQPININIGFVVTGRRHHNVFNTMEILSNNISLHTQYDHIQGFITSKDYFVTREQAALIALAVGQIKEPTTILFSEDLY